MKRKIGIIVAIILAVLIVGVSYAIYSDQNSPTILKLQTVKRKSVPRKYIDTKNSTYYAVKANGKITKCPAFKVHNQIVEVNPEILTSYEKNNTTHLKIRAKYRSKKLFEPHVTDPNYRKLLNQVIKQVHYDVYRLQFYKVNPQSYYVYFQINAGISDAGDLYHFIPGKKELIKVCELDNLEIIGIKEIKKQQINFCCFSYFLVYFFVLEDAF